MLLTTSNKVHQRQTVTRASLGHPVNFVTWLIVGLAGAVDSVYGRTQYFADWISYLNVSREITALNWRGIFDPMWPPGYPALVALIRAIFPRTAEGEWYAISLLNWIIFLCAYASWRYLVRKVIESQKPNVAGLADHPVTTGITSCIFLSCTLCLDQVSSVSPDLLVTTLFLLAAAQSICLILRPTVSTAVILGVVLGTGCWVKGVFLPFACIFIGTLIAAAFLVKLPWRALAITSAVFISLLIPYVGAISASSGHLTLGASGALNYAFHVNKVPHWTNWQGGGAGELGRPIHTTRQLLPDQPIFEFSNFRSTYPPFNNISHWYEGIRQSFHLKRQLYVIARSIWELGRAVANRPFLISLVLALAVVLLQRNWRASLYRRLRVSWPVLLPASLGMATYLFVHVEERYLTVFCLVLGLIPFLPLLDENAHKRIQLVTTLLVICVLGAVFDLGKANGPVFKAALQQRDFHQDRQWKIAGLLRSYGLADGDPIAIIGGNEPSYRCSWAYVARLRIVAEFGGLPWSVAPFDRTRFDHDPEQADENYAELFWNLPAAERNRVIDAFRQVQPKAILSLWRPSSTPESGWQQVGGTGAWIYRFEQQLHLLSEKH